MTETVIVSDRRSGRAIERYHTDDDCRALATMASPQRRDRDSLPAGVRECSYCAGEFEAVAPVDPQGTRNALLMARPEDLGLSPMGDRR